MENAMDALQMAFAVIVLVLAISVAIAMFSKVNEVSQIVLTRTDGTNYYTYIANDENEAEEAQTRIVGLETIIPTLYKYYKENYTVLFLDEDGTPLKLYESQTEESLWGSGNETGIIGKYYKDGKDTNPVCSFDVDEETIRHEPWTGTVSDYKENLDVFLLGGIFYYPSANGEFYNYNNKYTRGGFIAEYGDDKFKETLGEYTYNLTTEEEEEGIENLLLKNKKKRVIIYQLQPKN